MEFLIQLLRLDSSLGASSSLSAALLTQPFDVVKTHREMARHKTALGEVVVLTPAGLRGILALYREGGMRMLFRGLSLRLWTVIPGSVLMISVYEYVKSSV